jgi:hypothetical protein
MKCFAIAPWAGAAGLGRSSDPRLGIALGHLRETRFEQRQQLEHDRDGSALVAGVSFRFRRSNVKPRPGEVDVGPGEAVRLAWTPQAGVAGQGEEQPLFERRQGVEELREVGRLGVVPNGARDRTARESGERVFR